MSATGNEVITLSQLKEVYNSNKSCASFWQHNLYFKTS